MDGAGRSCVISLVRSGEWVRDKTRCVNHGQGLGRDGGWVSKSQEGKGPERERERESPSGAQSWS